MVFEIPSFLKGVNAAKEMHIIDWLIPSNNCLPACLK